MLYYTEIDMSIYYSNPNSHISPLSTSTPFTLSMTKSMSNSTCINAMSSVIPDEDCDFMTKAAFIFVVTSIVLIVFGVATNTWLMVVLLSKARRYRTVPDILVLHMAVLAVIMFVVVAGSNVVIFSQVAFQVKFFLTLKQNKAILYFQVFISLASFATLVVLALDRYAAIVHPLLSRPYRTKRNTVICCGCVWLVCGVWVVPIVINGGSSNIFEDYAKPSFKTTVILFTVFIYGISVAIFIVCYAAILKVVWRNPFHGHSSAREHSAKNCRLKQRNQILKTVLIIVSSNVVNYGYFFGVMLWIACAGHTRVSVRFSNTLVYSAILVAYLNPCINPCVYALHQFTLRRRYLPQRKHYSRPSSSKDCPLPSTRSEIRAREEYI